MKILIDLNVLLDVFQEREPHYRASAAICHYGLSGLFALYIPAHAIPTLYYIIRKGADQTTANEAIDWLLGNFEITRLDKEVLEEASRLASDDFEDSVVSASAKSCRCNFIVTRNVVDFKTSSVPALTPADFLKTMAQEIFP